jgi:TonB family protein
VLQLGQAAISKRRAERVPPLIADVRQLGPFQMNCRRICFLVATTALASAACFVNAQTEPPPTEVSNTPSRIPLPKASIIESRSFYPSKLRRLDLEGSVDVEFRIADDGRVQSDMIVKAATNKEFVSPALGVIGNFKYSVPSDWARSGLAEHWFQAQVRFVLTPCPEVPKDDDREIIQICATRIPR